MEGQEKSIKGRGLGKEFKYAYIERRDKNKRR